VIEVALVGGPADRRVWVCPGDEPPAVIDVPGVNGPHGYETLTVPAHYDTQPSPLLDGPAWIAVHRDEL
jgi:hypothetical protein